MYDETAKGWSSAGQAPPIYNETAKDCSSAGQAPPTYNAAANGCSSAGQAPPIYNGTAKAANSFLPAPDDSPRYAIDLILGGRLPFRPYGTDKARGAYASHQIPRERGASQGCQTVPPVSSMQ